MAEITVELTREESKGKLGELVKAYNEALQEKKNDVALTCDSEIKEAIKKYTALSRQECFEACKNSENPMIEAIKTLTFKTIGVKDEKRDDVPIPVRVIVEKEKRIELDKLHKYAGGIGVDTKWIHRAEKLNLLLTVKTAMSVGISTERIKEINDSIYISEVARAIDMGKTPMSNTSLLKALNAVVEAMIGEEYKASSHDVNFLKEVYAQLGSTPRTIACPKIGRFCNYLLDICNHIVERNSYDVSHKKIKTKAE